MDISRESISQKTAITNIDWLRKNTPYMEDKRAVRIDSAEFEIRHKGIEKLERNIKHDTEYIICFVHFNHDTNEREGIYLSVWDSNSVWCRPKSRSDEPLAVDLNEAEIELLYGYALEQINMRKRHRVSGKRRSDCDVL